MSKKVNRVTIIVMDSLGVGYAEDADKFGDVGANTLLHIIEQCKGLDIPNLRKLGMYNLPGFEHLGICENPAGAFGRMREISKGKDTTTGHWEIAGIETEIPFKTYPDGFPEEFIQKFEKAIGRKTVGNLPYSGTEIIEKYGDHHEKTGDVIVYTSDDSVFQIAANVDVVPLEELYEMCKTARKMLVGDWACARVIARPYKIIDGKRVRTDDRHDYSVKPPKDTILDMLKAAGKEVYAIGKIRDIFDGKGIVTAVPTKGNQDGVNKTIEALKEDFQGLIFTNLVDFDSKYGHRRNPQGYGNAIEEFDKNLPDILDALKDGDILIITADHGNDPTFKGFNHTREFVPLLVYGKPIKKGVNLGTRETFGDIARTIAEIFETEKPEIGNDFSKDILL